MKELKDLHLKEWKQLASLSLKDIQEEITKAEKKRYELTMKKEAGELKQTHFVKALRRYIARAKTIASTKEV